MTKVRIAIAALTLSAAGFVGILNREGFEPMAYPDPVHGTKLPTIGFGSTEGVKMGDTITPVAAVNRSLREVRVFERETSVASESDAQGEEAGALGEVVVVDPGAVGFDVVACRSGVAAVELDPAVHLVTARHYSSITL